MDRPRRPDEPDEPEEPDQPDDGDPTDRPRPDDNPENVSAEQPRKWHEFAFDDTNEIAEELDTFYAYQEKDKLRAEGYDPALLDEIFGTDAELGITDDGPAPYPGHIDPPDQSDQHTDADNTASIAEPQVADTTAGETAGYERLDTPAQPTDTPSTTTTDQPEIPLWQTIADETGEVRSFADYETAKKELGTRPGEHIHHIVEQSQAKPERSGFSVERINTTDNLVRLPEDIHIKQITAHYARKVPGQNIKVRDMLNGTPWDFQYEYGCDVLDDAMRGRL